MSWGGGNNNITFNEKFLYKYPYFVSHCEGTLCIVNHVLQSLSVAWPSEWLIVLYQPHRVEAQTLTPAMTECLADAPIQHCPVRPSHKNARLLGNSSWFPEEMKGRGLQCVWVCAWRKVRVRLHAEKQLLRVGTEPWRTLWVVSRDSPVGKWEMSHPMGLHRCMTLNFRAASVV